jgi:Fe-S oxidoreductase
MDVCPAHIATVPIFEALRFQSACERPPSAALRFLMRKVLPSKRVTRLGASAAALVSMLLPFGRRQVRYSAPLEVALAAIPAAQRPASLVHHPVAHKAFNKCNLSPCGSSGRNASIHAILSPQVVALPSMGTIGYFLDCLTDIYFPQTFAGVVRYLNQNGYTVAINPDAGCCGASALNTGDEAAFVKMALAYAKAFSESPFERILFSNPTCYKTVKERYQEILGDKYYMLPEPVLDVEMFAKLPPPYLHPAWKNITVAWHNPCALGMALGDKTTGTSILRKWGFNVTTEVVPEECCGYGGLFNLRYPEFASGLSEKKLRIWQDAGVDLVLTCSAGCITHLNETAAFKYIPIPTLHWGELL